ncbi:amidohydrolase family protein [Nocardiopsis ganjiahuensis]|uniref:amidohydrolase family protein n=1 Tax=Nocardiopsis ganjiahuensis TaxID=239984 RepID=UPI0003480FF8|nr:amidohydrolase family protein [Nocardiopsis ganjiahuensis]
MRAYTHATVIDATGTPPLPDHTVLVENGVITAVGPTATTSVPESAEVVDLTGRYLIPGLTDAHTHSNGDERIAPALHVLNGVTAVREMWGSDEQRGFRDRMDAGTSLGPRWTIAGNLIDGAPSLWDDAPGPQAPTVVANPREARRAVNQSKDEGADFVKIYSRLDADSYHAILDEARRLDIPVAGHRSDHVPLLEQIESGQRSFEHVHGLWPALSRDAEAMEAAMDRIRLQPDTYYSSWFQQVNEVEWEAANTYGPAESASVFERMVANEVAYCPTLFMHKNLDLPERVRLTDPRMRYMTPDTAQIWSYVLDSMYLKGRSADEAAKRRVLFELRRAVVSAMDEAGVRILAGTDTQTVGVIPGFALHEELEQMVEAGLTPLRALQTATLEPARFLGREAWSGTVEPGRVADLLVLDADPLADIRNTTRIHSVVTRGRHIGPEERTALLAEVEKAASGA